MTGKTWPCPAVFPAQILSESLFSSEKVAAEITRIGRGRLAALVKVVSRSKRRWLVQHLNPKRLRHLPKVMRRHDI